MSGSLLLVGLKLILQPVLAWVLADAGLPAGTGAHASRGGAGGAADRHRPVHARRSSNGREATITARSILLSTIGSMVTVSAYLAWVGVSGAACAGGRIFCGTSGRREA